jgi:hypothetical protein
MPTLNEQIQDLQQRIKELESKIKELSLNTENKPVIYSISDSVDKANIRPTDIKTGRGAEYGSSIAWNDTELDRPPINAEPDEPRFGYHKHSHDRFSGGALIKDMLEIVEYVWDTITNKHSQQFWTSQPQIAKEQNSHGEQVNKIGPLDLIFNADTIKWGVASYEIDVKKCYLVERDVNGNIALDSRGNQKKSPLYNSDTTKTSVVWDSDAQVWRFYSVYAPGS